VEILLKLVRKTAEGRASSWSLERQLPVHAFLPNHGLETCQEVIEALELEKYRNLLANGRQHSIAIEEPLH
jgi:hypothetical protein